MLSASRSAADIPFLCNGDVPESYDHKCGCPHCEAAYKVWSLWYIRSLRPKPKENARPSDYESHHWDEKLNAVPMRAVLRRECQSIGIGNVAFACGVDAKRIRDVINGYYWKTLADGTKKKYPYNFITLRIADTWLTALGYMLTDVYPYD